MSFTDRYLPEHDTVLTLTMLNNTHIIDSEYKNKFGFLFAVPICFLCCNLKKQYSYITHKNTTNKIKYKCTLQNKTKNKKTKAIIFLERLHNEFEFLK